MDALWLSEVTPHTAHQQGSTGSLNGDVMAWAVEEGKCQVQSPALEDSLSADVALRPPKEFIHPCVGLLPRIKYASLKCELPTLNDYHTGIRKTLIYESVG